jgi:hypothetical protein
VYLLNVGITTAVLRVGLENMETDQLGYVGPNVRLIQSRRLKRIRPGFSWLGIWSSGGVYCGHSNESLDFMKSVEYLDQVSDSGILKDFASLSRFWKIVGN